MHIAVCNNNKAKRHYVEHSLKRRSNGYSFFFIDSYGNCDDLLSNPTIYDAYYIEICKSGNQTCVDVITKLIEKGVSGPIILCCSDINYQEYQLPENVLFLSKPISVNELCKSLDQALTVEDPSIPRIELRDETNTYYVTEADILYAEETGRYVTVTLTDGRQIQILADAANFFELVKDFETFFAPTTKSVINGRYIVKLGRHRATMTNKKTFWLHRDCMSYAQQIFMAYGRINFWL